MAFSLSAKSAATIQPKRQGVNRSTPRIAAAGALAPHRLAHVATSSSSTCSRSSRLVTRATGSSAPPTPIVKIDNMTDSFATIVSVEFGDRMGEMLDTITALKNIGLNIRRAKLRETGQVSKPCTKFFITEAETSEKIVKSARLEEIRLCVLESLSDTFPDFQGGSLTSAPSDSEIKALGRRNIVPTTVEVSEAPNGSCSLLKIVTADRPGLLVDIVRVMKDISLNVVSAEVDTIGNQAVDIFFLTYHGEPLSSSMTTLVTNSLQYYLSLNEVSREESY